MIKYIDSLSKEDLKGKRVLLRLDLNVPIENGQIKDTYRLEKAVSTVDYLREMEAKIIILAHLENKDGGNDTLFPILSYLSGYFKTDFSPTFFTPESIEKLLKLENKEVLLFENIRINNPGEKENDMEFAKKLSQMADIYVNDAFSVSHREHASVVGVPEFLPHYGGLILKKEIEHLSKVFNPEHPFVFILGGAKFKTKFPLVKKYLKTADTVFIGGALANDVLKAKGLEVGTSLVGEHDFGISEIISDPKLKTFSDVTVIDEKNQIIFKKISEVKPDECIVDSGPETLGDLKNILNGAKTIVWNGPLGNYEKGFSDKTESLAEIITHETSKGAVSIIGGGDTIAAIQKLNIEHKFTFVSTGGGAMLDYLVNETLVGIEALE
ncbi:MAG TPA: phosphoglycerate kinase [Candidatus Paceibacterota bacterium]